MADLSYHPEARHEIREAAAFYQRRRQGLGEEFLAELERIIGKILVNPLRCATISGRFRCCLVKRFPFSIIRRRPYGACGLSAADPGACAPGYTPSPLRGYQSRGVFKILTRL